MFYLSAQLSSSLECKLHEVKNFVLSTAVFPVPKTALGIERVLGKFLIKERRKGGKNERRKKGKGKGEENKRKEKNSKEKKRNKKNFT